MSTTVPPAAPPSTPEPRPPRQIQMVSAPRNPTEMELEVYKSMVSLFNSEESAFWTRNNILAVIHGGLLAATAGIVSNSEKALSTDAPHFAYTLLFAALTVLALVGLGMAVAWRFMVARGQRIADTISQKLKEIERELAGRAQLNFSPVFHAFIHFGDRLSDPPPEQDPASQRYSQVRLAQIWGRVGQCLMWLWSALALAFFLLLITGYARPQASGPAAGSAALRPTWGAASGAASATGPDTNTAALIAAVAQATAAARAATDAAQSAASAAAAATRAAQQAATATPAATATTTPTPNAGGAPSPSASGPGGIAAGGATPPVHAHPQARTHTHTHAAPRPCTCATRASGAR